MMDGSRMVGMVYGDLGFGDDGMMIGDGWMIRDDRNGVWLSPKLPR